MRYALHLAAAVTLFAAATAHAQITNPDNLVAPPPRNPVDRHHVKPHPEAQQWLWAYTSPEPGGNKQSLLDDPRFPDLLATDLRAPQSMWGTGIPLAEAARTFLSGEGTVSSTDNRHIVITGCVPDHCPQRGLLWLDLGGSTPLTVFSALRWAEQSRSTDEPQAPFNLWIFPSRELAANELPAALKSSLSAWVNANHCSTVINHVLLVEPNGIPHILGAIDAGVQPVCAPSNPTGTPQ